MKVTDILSRDEIATLTRASNLRGAWSVVVDWSLVAASMALVAWLPNVATILLALIVIGGRQLGLAILAHECAHKSLFARKSLHDPIGVWLCAAPIWTDMLRYREHHRRHHNHTGTDADPDHVLARPFPITRASLARKFLRDLVGWTAVRRIGALLAIDFGFLNYTVSSFAGWHPPMKLGARLRFAAGHLYPVVLTNLALFSALWLLGRPELYLLWVGAWFTTYSLALRIRGIAEHAGTEWVPDPLRNTRTTYAGWLARLFLAPHHVNYHLEHHLLMTVPHYRLADLHVLLKERGHLGPHNVATSYRQVFALVTH
ncbi:MAG: fatty acid desaturase family protein [Myxococcota bacterium]